MRSSVLLALLVASIAVAQPSEPPRGRRGGPDILTPPGWWHDPYLAGEVKPTGEQTRKLDQLHEAGREEMARLERESSAADRELRAALNDRAAAAPQIVAAGNRLATIRDQILRRQINLLASQRALLTHAQWTALQQQIAARRPPHDRGRADGPPRPLR